LYTVLNIVCLSSENKRLQFNILMFSSSYLLLVVMKRWTKNDGYKISFLSFFVFGKSLSGETNFDEIDL